MKYSKEEQLGKKKKTNHKKLSGNDKREYIDFLREISGGICQIPGCNNSAQDWEHPDRGINRDDRYTIMICRECHLKADGHTKVSLDVRIKLKLAGKRIGRDNWRQYNEDN
jgi:hypothetical protein